MITTERLSEIEKTLASCGPVVQDMSQELLSEIAQKQAKIERLTRELEIVRSAAEVEIETLTLQRDEFRRLLREYGSHLDNCRSHDPYVAGSRNPECDCGWREIKEAARKAEGGDDE